MSVWECMGHCRPVASLTGSGQGGVVSNSFCFTCSNNWLISLHGR